MKKVVKSLEALEDGEAPPPGYVVICSCMFTLLFLLLRTFEQATPPPLV